MTQITEAYLRFLKGEAVDAVNQPFSDAYNVDGYQRSLIDLIETYGAVPEQIGRQSGMLVKRMPNNEDPLVDAFLANAILQETALALQQLVDDDETLRKGASAKSPTTDEEDAEIRRDAQQFDQDFNIDAPKLQQYRDSAKGSPHEIDDAGIRNSFYGGDAASVERTVEKSAQGPKQKIAVPVQQFVERNEKWNRETINLHAPDCKGKSPSMAFREATRWLAQTIVSLAVGTTKSNQYPRLQPLLDLQQTFPQYAQTADGIRKLMQKVLDLTAALRAPGENTETIDLGTGVRILITPQHLSDFDSSDSSDVSPYGLHDEEWNSEEEPNDEDDQ